MELYVIQNQVGIEIAVANLEMFLPCDKGESAAHLQQIAGNMLHQLFFYVPFVRTFFGSCQVKDIRVFQQVVGKVTLGCRKRSSKIIDLVAVNLSFVQFAFNLHFKDIAAPAHFHGLLHIPVLHAQRKRTVEHNHMACPIDSCDRRCQEEFFHIFNRYSVSGGDCLGYILNLCKRFLHNCNFLVV